MPTYEYKCDTCGLVFEEYQSITAEPLTSCKKADCNGRVQRLFSAGAGFLFKGSGFYITDYRSDSYKKSATSESGSGSKTSTEKSSSASATSSNTSAPASSNSGPVATPKKIA